MPTKRSVKPPQTPHIIVGFSFPNIQRPDEVITGSTRYGIVLSLSSQIFAQLCSQQAANQGDIAANGRNIADAAFQLTDAYMAKLDQDVAQKILEAPPAPTNNAKK